MSEPLLVHIDEPTWDKATPERRAEFRIAIQELSQDAQLEFQEGTRLVEVMNTAQGFSLQLKDDAGDVLSAASVPRTVLSNHVTEYVDIVRQMERADEFGRHRLEALDMAKKMSHDEAADTLLKELSQLGLNHSTARRLWTLLLSLRVDTTKLTGVRGHRPIR